MSAEFRQRKPSEYLKILRRRKWLIILPAIAISDRRCVGCLSTSGRLRVNDTHCGQALNAA